MQSLISPCFSSAIQRSPGIGKFPAALDGVVVAQCRLGRAGQRRPAQEHHVDRRRADHNPLGAQRGAVASDRTHAHVLGRSAERCRKLAQPLVDPIRPVRTHAVHPQHVQRGRRRQGLGQGQQAFECAGVFFARPFDKRQVVGCRVGRGTGREARHRDRQDQDSRRSRGLSASLAPPPRNRKAPPLLAYETWIARASKRSQCTSK